MKNHPKCYGIIPARYNSSRFPGKPLAEIQNKPMFWHVYQQACKCSELNRVTLATDDQRIFSAAEKLDIPVVMTRNDHASGTDRVLEAATILRIPDNTVVVNIQGDEPLLEPAMLTELLLPFSDPEIKVTTLARKISFSNAERPDLVKVVFSKTQRALYFSRAIIPFHREQQDQPYYGHIGLYAFRMDTLNQFVKLNPSGLEVTEKLEQLRLIENDIPIHVSITKYKSISVDRPEDIDKVNEILLKKD